jgi:PHD/YefM family antitoxin component YafN of YafNO toxin-antitoxin module
MNNSENQELGMRVSTADFIKNYSSLADRALGEPVTITKHGRDRLVMVSAAEYERLKRRDRQVFQSADLPDAVLEQIAKAEVPAEFAHLDAELEDRKA